MVQHVSSIKLCSNLVNRRRNTTVECRRLAGFHVEKRDATHGPRKETRDSDSSVDGSRVSIDKIN